jgi:two-component system, OmpR family, phosphate regulon response regulator PhoB
MLPRMSGTEVAAAIRSDPRTADLPIIMVTAKVEESDVVVGLHAGADDYVTKPFSMAVLAARIAAALRRKATLDLAASGQNLITVGAIRIDRDQHRVGGGGRNVVLTLTEFRLLLAIVAGRGRVLTRNQLIEEALGVDAVVTDRTIDVHMTALRRKLGRSRKCIQTVRGVGFRLDNQHETV